jgi:hypothetical protein
MLAGIAAIALAIIFAAVALISVTGAGVMLMIAPSRATPKSHQRFLLQSFQRFLQSQSLLQKMVSLAC